jgi:hypothetical protein
MPRFLEALRPYVAPLAIYLITRLMTVAVVMAAAAGRVVPLESLPGYHAYHVAPLPPDYSAVMTSWDGQWYWDIAENGYPGSSLGPDGQPAQTSLAFFPLFPLLVRAAMYLTGAAFDLVAPSVSLVVGAAATLVVFRLVEACADRRRALAVVALLCTFASAPVLQAAYTESLALLLVAASLLLLRNQRYLWCCIPVILMGLTRNVALVFALVVAVHWIWRVSSRQGLRNATRPVPHTRLAVLFATSLFAAVLWPITTALLTREVDAYTNTLKAWPGFSGSVLKPPLAGLLSSSPYLSVAALAALAGLYVAIRLLPGRRRFGPELTAWAAFYPLYILTVSSATFSVVRYLLFAFPLALVWMPETDDVQQHRRQRAVVASLVVLGLLAQWLWVSKLLVFAGDAGGWGFP